MILTPLLRYKKVIWSFLALALLSLALFIYNKPAHYILRNYKVDSSGARALAVSVLIPYTLELILALVAYLSIRLYADTLEDGREKSAFNDFKRGQFLLTLFYGIAPLLAGLILYAENTHSLEKVRMVQIADYVNIAISVYASVLFYRASRKLLSIAKYTGRRILYTTIGIYVVVTVAYFLLTRSSMANGTIDHPSLLTLVMPTTFHAHSLIGVITIFIPRLASWYLFGLAAQNFFLFHANVKGMIYRRAFLTIPYGITIALSGVVITRVLQLMTTSQSDFGPIAVLVYTCLTSLLTIIGFALFANGARKLYAIEKA